MRCTSWAVESVLVDSKNHLLATPEGISQNAVGGGGEKEIRSCREIVYPQHNK